MPAWSCMYTRAVAQMLAHNSPEVGDCKIAIDSSDEWESRSHARQPSSLHRDQQQITETKDYVYSLNTEPVRHAVIDILKENGLRVDSE